MQRHELVAKLVKEHAWSKETFEVWHRCEFHCTYCCMNHLETLDNFKLGTRDHLLPVSSYPRLANDPYNLVLACDTCNKLKRDWDPNGDGKPVVGDDCTALTEDQRDELVRRARHYVNQRRTERNAKFKEEKKLIEQWRKAS